MVASKQIAENYVETGRKKAELSVSHMLILGFFAGMFIALAGAGASLLVGGFGCLGSNDKCLGIADCFGTCIPGRIGAGGLHRGGTFHWELPDDDLGAAETDFRGRAV